VGSPHQVAASAGERMGALKNSAAKVEPFLRAVKTYHDGLNRRCDAL